MQFKLEAILIAAFALATTVLAVPAPNPQNDPCSLTNTNLKGECQTAVFRRDLPT